VFGLGNKQYEHFNAVGKRMHTNMEALGAAAVCRRGDGDDDDSIDDDFEKWCTELFAALDEKPELLGAAAVGGGSETLAAYRVEVLPAGACENGKPGGWQGGVWGPGRARVLQSVRREVLHLQHTGWRCCLQVREVTSQKAGRVVFGDRAELDVCAVCSVALAAYTGWRYCLQVREWQARGLARWCLETGQS
jgi:hypothetical protein